MSEPTLRSMEMLTPSYKGMSWFLLELSLEKMLTSAPSYIAKMGQPGEFVCLFKRGWTNTRNTMKF